MREMDKNESAAQMRHRVEGRHKKGATSSYMAADNPLILLNAPGRIRTSGPEIRNLVLYPAELQGLDQTNDRADPLGLSSKAHPRKRIYGETRFPEHGS